MHIPLNSQIVQDWTKSAEIIYSFNNEFGELYVLLKAKNPRGKDIFAVLKFFSIGDKIQVSQEVPFDDTQEVLISLFRKL